MQTPLTATLCSLLVSATITVTKMASTAVHWLLVDHLMQPMAAGEALLGAVITSSVWGDRADDAVTGMVSPDVLCH